jgi:hypothetical protein
MSKKIRSKKNNLFNYFACDHKDLSNGYLKSCNDFFKSINKKPIESKEIKVNQIRLKNLGLIK